MNIISIYRLPSSFATTSKIYQDDSVLGLRNSSKDFQPQVLGNQQYIRDKYLGNKQIL